MATTLTKSQFNKIGERLRKNQESDQDLRALDDLRLSFEPAYQQVFDYLTQLGLKPGGRAGKTTLSIRAKLLRERTRLSRMQDIAGCRVVVDGTVEQDRIIRELEAAFPENEVFDRRKTPSHGYRAVHIVAFISGMPVEVQIRTSLQHEWAEVSEKLSDVLDPAVKYGGGPAIVRTALDKLSVLIKTEEDVEEALRITRDADNGRAFTQAFEEMEASLREQKLQLHDRCRELIIILENP